LVRFPLRNTGFATNELSLAPFPVQVAPVVANGLVFTADGGCHCDTCNLVARDARTGALLWSSPFLDELHWQSPHPRRRRALHHRQQRADVEVRAAGQ
jgi:hypothetical protein